MADDELKKLIESNARAIQAMLDARATERLEFQEFRQRMEASVSGLQDVTMRLANLQEGMARMLASLDEDRPTMLRKLNSIEGKVDRLLDQHDRANDP